MREGWKCKARSVARTWNIQPDPQGHAQKSRPESDLLKIVFGSEDKKIEYLYDAVGTKVRKTVYSLWRSAPVIDVVDYQQGFQYLNNRLQFFPTAEGYVDCTHTVSSTAYNYVYQYKDHLGNTRLSYGTDAVGAVRIMQEQHYYPFGLQHENYNVETMAFRADENDLVALRDLFDPEPEPEELVKLPYNYKYQGQERQDELGLNWDSFKWRNYDYAIGRFMSIDPLAEKYAYNSPYAFQENKMGLGRELEGLEMTSERSKDGKSVTLTMKVNAVNKSLNINGDQYKTILAARIKNTESALSGSIGGGVTVNAKVVVNPKATMTMEFNDAIDPKGVKSFENSKSPEKVQNSVDSALGVASEIGNTQVNKVQVNVPRNLEFDAAGMPIIDAKNLNYISNTGTHEDLHAAGLEHVDDAKNRMNYENAGGTKLTEEQRKTIIDNVEKQQPQ